MCLQRLRFFPTIVQRDLSTGLFPHYHLQTCISSSSCAAMDMNLICNLDVSMPGQVIEDEDDDNDDDDDDFVGGDDTLVVGVKIWGF